MIKLASSSHPVLRWNKFSQQDLLVLGGDQVYSDLPNKAKGTLVSETNETRHPTTNQDSEQLGHSDRPDRVMDGLNHPNRKNNQLRRLDAFREECLVGLSKLYSRARGSTPSIRISQPYPSLFLASIL